MSGSAADGATTCHRGGEPSSQAAPRTWCCDHETRRGDVGYVQDTNPTQMQAPRTPARPVRVEANRRDNGRREGDSYHADYRGYRDKAFDELSTSPIPPSVLRLDVHDITNSGHDGADTAQRILHALTQAFENNLHFSVAVPGKDLPARWAWR
jgi:hypothetical protein